MRRLRLFVAFAAMATTLPAAAEEDLPFEAYVVPEESAVYSGPAEPRYVTHYVPRGTKVEVYERRDEWLGIRPPAGSFSWIPAAAMEMAPEPAVAKAAADGVAAWIGSSAERVQQHQSTVQLKRGEPVEVLGTKEVETEAGQRETWLKIAPPAGEFRWIHASQVSRDAPPAFRATAAEEPDSQKWSSRLVDRRIRARDDDAPKTAAANKPLAGTPGPFRRNSMELRDLVPPTRQAAFQREAADDGVQQAAHETEAAQPNATSRPRSPDGFVPRQPRPGRSTPRNSAPSTRSPAPPALVASVPAGSPPVAEAPSTEPSPAAEAGISSAAVQRRLQEIDNALSLMISGDRSQWNLSALRREVQQLVENGATPVDRGEARFMLEKIERFAEAFGVEDDDFARDLAVGSAAARKAALEAATAPKYDGTGYLTPVRAAKPVAPYALLDGSGHRLCYVTPVPGFNLRAYENRRIGVFGKRGYMAEAGAAHLLAERVVDLDKQAR